MSADRSLLDAFVANLRETLDPAAVVLFGSRARGENFPESDYDVLVVSDRFEGVHPVRRRETAIRAWPAHKAVDILCLTEGELLALDRPVTWDALEEGVVLHDSGVWERALEAFRKLRREGRLVPVPGGWRLTEQSGDPG
ncbi:MAG: nucleotidyltransferase domain-containing protein [Firmicutes bacterium]|nr:nucleotidyltransferase domain-containing protein [Bacillota bacterium]